MSERRQHLDRRTPTTIEHKFEILLRAMIAFAVIFVVAFGLGLLRVGAVAQDAHDAASSANQAIATAEAEREARSQVVAHLVEFGCNTDNGQDKLLARLVEASLNSNSTFGAGVDPATLTPFDLQVLATIAKVQQSAGSNTPLTRRFRRVLGQLRDLTDCRALVRSYLEGDPLPLHTGPPGAGHRQPPH